jgi:HAE1 family hydrophobic/amphiphilic exporter-1
VAIGSGEGAMFRAPLGVAVIGGTITSTLLTLLVIPVVYALLDGARELVRGWRGAHAAPAASGTGPSKREALA